ncbi:MAG: alpha/beta fold hydrolase [Actinomycetota bacterium]|nr:alpha/beta fold hydrolase [Actinomycetota bacterium]
MPNVRANGIDLEYDEFGDPGDPGFLLVMGFTAQLTAWDERFCTQLAGHGFRVVRYDNRDVGLSSRITEGPTPDITKAFSGDHSSASYTIADMADDAAGLLDALELAPAHVMGVSMGGMIVQSLAIRHADKVRSLCSVMSTTGDLSVGQASPEAIGALMAPPPANREEAADRAVAGTKVIGSPGYPQDEGAVRQRAMASYDRSHDPAGYARQLVGIAASPDRTADLGSVEVPTLVIHGEVDPLIDVSGGRATAGAIPGAELVVIPDMGHDLPPQLWDQIIAAAVVNASKAG